MTFALASERECDVMTIVIVVLVARYSRTFHITLMSHFIISIWSLGIFFYHIYLARVSRLMTKCCGIWASARLAT